MKHVYISMKLKENHSLSCENSLAFFSQDNPNTDLIKNKSFSSKSILKYFYALVTTEFKSGNATKY